MPSFSKGGRIGSPQSDLTVEEQLAAGASTDDLVASGVLSDDYDPDSEYYDFTPLEPVEEHIPGPPMSDEEFELALARARWGSEVRRLGKDAPPRPPLPTLYVRE